MEGVPFFKHIRTIRQSQVALSAMRRFFILSLVTLTFTGCLKTGLTSTSYDQATNTVSNSGNSTAIPGATCATFGAFTSATQCRSGGATCENFMPTGTVLSCWREVTRTPASTDCNTIDPLYFNDLSACQNSRTPAVACEKKTITPECFSVVQGAPPKTDCYSLQVSSGIFGQSGFYDSQKECEVLFGWGKCELLPSVSLPFINGVHQLASNCWRRTPPPPPVLSLTKLGITPSLSKIKDLSSGRVVSKACEPQGAQNDGILDGTNGLLFSSSAHNGLPNTAYFDPKNTVFSCPVGTTPVGGSNWTGDLWVYSTYTTFPFTIISGLKLHPDYKNEWNFCRVSSAPYGTYAAAYKKPGSNDVYFGYRALGSGSSRFCLPSTNGSVQQPQVASIQKTNNWENLEWGDFYCDILKSPRQSPSYSTISSTSYRGDPYFDGDGDFALIDFGRDTSGTKTPIFYVSPTLSKKVIAARCPTEMPNQNDYTVELIQGNSNESKDARCLIKPNGRSTNQFFIQSVTHPTNGSVALSLGYLKNGTCHRNDIMDLTGRFCTFSFLTPAVTLTQGPQAHLNQQIELVQSYYTPNEVNHHTLGWTVPAKFSDNLDFQKNCEAP